MRPSICSASRASWPADRAPGLRNLDAQDHYEVLEVARAARVEEIERAYRLATATWQEGSLALYSVFDERDAAAIRERVHRAYRILSNPSARRSYDQRLFDSVSEPGEPVEPAEVTTEPAADEDHLAPLETLDADLADVPEPDELFDGAQLRRTRMQRGIELDDIAEVTKVGRRYLQCIEEETFESLPAAVYVRGFVTAYARAIGLDPGRVSESYMPRLEAASRRKSRGGLLGRS
jgi:flagellar biosynthesis protein FlhG